MTTKVSILLTAASAFLISSVSAAPVLAVLGNGAKIVGVSGDGLTVLGKDNAGSFIWTQAGGRVAIPAEAPSGISADGTAVTGVSTAGGATVAYRWTQAGGFEYIPGQGSISIPPLTLPPTANGIAISGDGTTVVGAYSTTQTLQMAFKWKAGTSANVGDLNGGSLLSVAQAVSGDGSVVAGDSQSFNGQEAFAKVGDGPLQALGNVASTPPLNSTQYASSARGVSADGKTIVGFGNLYNALPGESQAVIRPVALLWKNVEGSVGSTTALNAITLTNTALRNAGTQAAAVNADGTAIVGSASIRTTIDNGLGNPPSYTFANAAVIWAGTTIHKRVSDALRAAGTDAVDELFQSAVGISADADTIVGNSANGGWIITGARPLFGFASAEVVLPRVTVAVGEAPVVTYDTVPGQSYQVQRSVSLNSDWTDLGEPFSTAGATGPGTHSVSDTTAPAGEKAFYRVTVQKAS